MWKKIVLILAISVIDITVKKQRPTVVMIGFLIAIVIVIAELIRFNIDKYITGFANNVYSSDTCFAVLIIVISMLVDYGSKTSKSLFENAQRAVLEQMAYMDELIKNFSDVLSNVFDLYGTVTRTGGDEFVVILDDITEEKVKSLLAQMLEQMEEKNKSASEVILSTAYGYAMKGEIPLNQEQNEKIELKVVDIGPRAVYRIADDRMYENKRKSKLGRR